MASKRTKRKSPKGKSPQPPSQRGSKRKAKPGTRNPKPAVKKFTFKKNRFHSKVAKLPKYLFDAINRKIIVDGYTHRQILEFIEGEVKKKKIKEEQVPSKSAIGKYTKRYTGQMAKIKLIEAQAKALVGEVGADSQALSEAVTKLAQSKLFDVLMGEVDDKLLAPMLVAAARLGQASAQREKLKFDIWKKLKDKAGKVADSVEKKVKKLGVSKKTSAEFKRDILGIADDRS